MKHGIDCQKEPHGSQGGYQHAKDDDTPYDIDGVTYCGRCHYWLGPIEQVDAPRPYRCGHPACLTRGCDEACNAALSPEAADAIDALDARRYRVLRANDPRFGMPVEWLKFETLDEAMDYELAKL